LNIQTDRHTHTHSLLYI